MEYGADRRREDSEEHPPLMEQSQGRDGPEKEEREMLESPLRLEFHRQPHQGKGRKEREGYSKKAGSCPIMDRSHEPKWVDTPKPEFSFRPPPLLRVPDGPHHPASHGILRSLVQARYASRSCFDESQAGFSLLIQQQTRAAFKRSRGGTSNTYMREGPRSSPKT